MQAMQLSPHGADQRGLWKRCLEEMVFERAGATVTSKRLGTHTPSAPLRTLRWISKPGVAVCDTHFMQVLIRILAGFGVVALAGCSALLPRSRAEDVSNFQSYEAAREALESVVPYRTTLADLESLGFDVRASANVQQVPYPQWVALLAHPNVPLDRADVGIRDCIAAEQACRSYAFRFGNLKQERRGNFAADFLNFRRVTLTHGWRFEGVMLVRDGVVLFRNHGGQPRIELVEDRRNPLGPLQTMGDSALRSLVP